MTRYLASAIVSLAVVLAYSSQANAAVAKPNFVSQINQAWFGDTELDGNIYKVAGIGKTLRKLVPGKLPGFKGLPSRPKTAPLPPARIKSPNGIPKAPSPASALPPTAAGNLPPANGLRNGGRFQRANVPTTPRRFDGNTVGIGNRSVRKANPTDNIADAAAKPSSWKAKAITGGIGVFILFQFAPDIIVSQIDFSTDEETAAAGN